jgi:hypothetical protein
MILHRPKTDLGGAPPAHPGKRVMRLRLVLLLIATPLTLALVLALAATLLPRGLSHAADKLPVEWVPGDIQNIQDQSGCHARQDATIKTSTPELASTIRDQVNLVKEKSLGENGLKLAYIWKADASGNSVVLEIETWYNDECPGPSASARQPGTGAEIQPASFQNSELRRAGLTKWVKTALAAVATGLVYATILTVMLGVIAAVAPEAAGAVVAILAGCVAGAAASVVGDALMTGSWKESLFSGLVGCAWGGVLGPAVQKVAQLAHEVIAAMLAGYRTVPWMGPGAAGAALEAGVELQPISDVVSATGEAVLRAAQ